MKDGTVTKMLYGSSTRRGTSQHAVPLFEPVNCGGLKRLSRYKKTSFLSTSTAFVQLQPFPSVTRKDGVEVRLLEREGEGARVRREEKEGGE